MKLCIFWSKAASRARRTLDGLYKAPKDWHILQWATINKAMNKRELYKSNDFWISRKPYYWGTHAYSIRREGMQLILDQGFQQWHSKWSLEVSRAWYYCCQWVGLLFSTEYLHFYMSMDCANRGFWTYFGKKHIFTTNNALEFGNSTLAVPSRWIYNKYCPPSLDWTASENLSTLSLVNTPSNTFI